MTTPAGRLHAPPVDPGPDGADVLGVRDERWTSFVTGHPAATAFHRPEWCELLSECYRFPAFVVVLRDGTGRVRAGLPVMEVRLRGRRPRWVSLPFSDGCPPLVEGPADLHVLASRLDALSRDAGVASAEVRAALPAGVGRQGVVATTHELDLAVGAAVLRDGYGSAVRRGLKRARAAGLQVTVADRRAQLTHDYVRLHVATRHRLGVPAQPRRYFDLLWEHLLAPGLGSLALVQDPHGVPVAGAVFLDGTSTVTYKYGASDEQGRALGANFLLFARTIDERAGAGWRRLDFGSSGLQDTGLQRFKRGWGARQSELRWTRVGGRADVPPPAGMDPRLRWALSHGPTLLTRAVGEALYRQTA